MTQLPPIHGGDPAMAKGASLNLATGINPWPWPMPDIPDHCYTELPYEQSGLREQAARYYKVKPENIVISAGSQPLIQLLPTLFSASRVLLPRVAYEEHAFRWSRAGHSLRYFSDYSEEGVLAQIAEEGIDHIVLVSPNNPDATVVTKPVLRCWLNALPAHGCMILDQAYADALTESDASGLIEQGRLLILRSVGKFWGLPGLRLGAMLADREWTARISLELGPWPICGVAQYVGERLFADSDWQAQTRRKLALAAERQSALLEGLLRGRYKSVHRQVLFTTFRMELAQALALQRAAFDAGVHTRVYHCASEGYMRWGLAADERELRRRLALLAKSLAVA